MSLTNNSLVSASVKTQRISASKARLVAVLLKNKPVYEALSILNHTNKKAAPIFKKLINSAIANAINNHGLEQSNLVVKAAIVNEGPTLKRFRPRAKGSASQILKRTSHFKVVLTNEYADSDFENTDFTSENHPYESDIDTNTQESDQKQTHMSAEINDSADKTIENNATEANLAQEADEKGDK